MSHGRFRNRGLDHSTCFCTTCWGFTSAETIIGNYIGAPVGIHSPIPCEAPGSLATGLSPLWIWLACRAWLQKPAAGVACSPKTASARHPLISQARREGLSFRVKGAVDAKMKRLEQLNQYLKISTNQQRKRNIDFLCNTHRSATSGNGTDGVA